MANREKFFEKLNKMSNEELAYSISFGCNDCPCFNYCSSNDGYSCNETVKEWLNEKLVKGVDIS